MKVGSLFTGIGGLDLALEAFGGEVVWQCDADPFCRAVLAKHWPGVRCYEDVRDIDGEAERVDVICGGFPCTDISQAAARTFASATVPGIYSGLWREFARTIRLVRPRHVFVENVEALRGRGMGEVLGDLASLGHDAEWDCVRACEAGAPHARSRMFLVSHANGDRESALPEHAQVAGVSTVAGHRWDGIAPPAGALGVADGVPGEMDRLRTLGNAVVPAQAALAWEVLSSRAARERAA